MSGAAPVGRVGRVGMIARWKPVHAGHAAVLEALTDRAAHAVVGIGSSNRYDVSNPFTAAETAEMIRVALAGRDNYSLVEVPDLGHGPRWRAMVLDLLGPLDLFATANGYVRSLLEGDYRVVHPALLVAPERRVAVDGSMVRRRMARGEDWASLVSPAVAAFLEERGLVERFRREFGLATLALDAPGTDRPPRRPCSSDHSKTILKGGSPGDRGPVSPALSAAKNGVNHA